MDVRMHIRCVYASENSTSRAALRQFDHDAARFATTRGITCKSAGAASVISPRGDHAIDIYLQARRSGTSQR